LTKNYQANKFVLDPNEGFGRNKRAVPLKSKEEREAEDGGTYSDDDGESSSCTMVTLCGSVIRAVCLGTEAVCLSAECAVGFITNSLCKHWGGRICRDR
jgi:hypothetical protein